MSSLARSQFAESKKSQLLDLTSQDLATIASTDPLLNASSTPNPNRFHKVDQVQLAGPDYPGAVINNAPYSEGDSTTACATVANAFQDTVTVGFSAGADFFGQGEKVTFTAAMTFGHASTSGNCAGTTVTASFTPRSSTVGVLVPIDVYEDGVFHTFAFMQSRPPTSQISSKVVTGVLTTANGQALANQIVTATFSNGSSRRLATDGNGKFAIAAPPVGTLTIRSGLIAQSVTLLAGQTDLPAMALKPTRVAPPANR